MKAPNGKWRGSAGCRPPQGLYYTEPGCDGTVAPVCAGPTFDACAITVCACDGSETAGCGFYDKAYRHVGPCTDATTPTDAGPDAH